MQGLRREPGPFVSGRVAERAAEPWALRWPAPLGTDRQRGKQLPAKPIRGWQPVGWLRANREAEKSWLVRCFRSIRKFDGRGSRRGAAPQGHAWIREQEK